MGDAGSKLIAVIYVLIVIAVIVAIYILIAGVPGVSK